jgi:hypothetical protein
MRSRPCALVVFGALTARPTIVCIHEEALPADPGANWLILARDTDMTPMSESIRSAAEEDPAQGPPPRRLIDSKDAH